jgi:hypothetical protein
MKKLFSLTAICVAMALVLLPVAYGQAVPGQDKAAPQAEKVFQGQLTKVDANAKKISVKGTGDKEMLFQYTEQTQVVGPKKDIQGLASQTGTQLKVTYRETGPDSHVATRIEILEK